MEIEIDAENENQPQRRQALQENGNRENPAQRLQQKTYFDEKNHQEKTQPAPIPSHGTGRCETD
jgi:hypothetical protein